MAMGIVKKHTKRVYSSIATNNGIVLCDKDDGGFLVLRCKEDIENLKALLDKIQFVE
jgi:uncharacterized pyridoxamine 5'-phosphate oxidase family protein